MTPAEVRRRGPRTAHRRAGSAARRGWYVQGQHWLLDDDALLAEGLTDLIRDAQGVIPNRRRCGHPREKLRCEWTVLRAQRDRAWTHLWRVRFSWLELVSFAFRVGQAAWLATSQACSASVSRENCRLGASCGWVTRMRSPRRICPLAIRFESGFTSRRSMARLSGLAP